MAEPGYRQTRNTFILSIAKCVRKSRFKPARRFGSLDKNSDDFAGLVEKPAYSTKVKRVMFYLLIAERELPFGHVALKLYHIYMYCFATVFSFNIFNFNFILPKVNTDCISQAQVLNIDNLRIKFYL